MAPRLGGRAKPERGLGRESSRHLHSLGPARARLDRTAAATAYPYDVDGRSRTRRHGLCRSAWPACVIASGGIKAASARRVVDVSEIAPTVPLDSNADLAATSIRSSGCNTVQAVPEDECYAIIREGSGPRALPTQRSVPTTPDLSTPGRRRAILPRLRLYTDRMGRVDVPEAAAPVISLHTSVRVTATAPLYAVAHDDDKRAMVEYLKTF